MDGSVGGEKTLKSNEDKIRDSETYVTEQLGLWDIMIMNEGYWQGLRRLVPDTRKSLPALYKMTQEVYSLSPVLLFLFCVSQIWNSCEYAINLRFSSDLLGVVESVLSGKIDDIEIVYRSILVRLLSLVCTCCISWYNQQILSRMRGRIKSHFELQLMRAKLGHGLEKSSRAEQLTNLDSDKVWQAFENVIRFIQSVIGALSQFALIFHLARGSGSPFFVVFCIIKPMFLIATRRNIWNKVWVVRQNNVFQARMQALAALTETSYRQDVISGDLKHYIISEYEKARNEMGDISDDPPEALYEKFQSPWPETILEILEDLPIFYCAIFAATSKQVSFTSVAILQKSASNMAGSIEGLAGGIGGYRRCLNQIRELYDIHNLSAKMTGDPCRAKAGKRDASATPGGMAFDLRDVSFTYPGSQTKAKALQDINLKIKAGEFVVFVGQNGSGKSTLIKVLSRLYRHPQDQENDDVSESDDDTSCVTGEILMDSLPASSYTDSSLRQSIAILSQENSIYLGFSLGENIGLGHTPLVSNEEAIMGAARGTGAAEVLNRMKDGTNTILDPMHQYYHYKVQSQDKSHPLKKLLKSFRSSTEVSGGERQRVVAARTFMRLKSGKIRLLVVDEPTSALDAEAEVTLLENLLKEREGKTVIFVTHRFGKLTRQADLIVCMKEGRIAESGTHQELMNLNGEYKKLYDIQAGAFQEEEGEVTRSSER